MTGRPRSIWLPVLALTCWPLLLLAVLSTITLAQAATLPRCDWWPTGRDPYTGSMGAALARIPGVPAAQRDALAARIALGDADDYVQISRSGITSQRARYAAEIRHMHFGARSVCSAIDRSRWPAGHTETGAVYRVAGSSTAVLIPAVCGNPAAVRVLGDLPTAAADVGGGHGSAGPASGDRVLLVDDLPAITTADGAQPSAAGGGGLRTLSSMLPMPALPTPPPAIALQQPPLAAPAPTAPALGAGPAVLLPWPVAAAPAIVVAPPLPAPVAAVSEPSTLLLLAAGLAALALRRMR